MYFNINLIKELKDKKFYYESSEYCLCEESEKGYEIIDHAYQILEYNDQLFLADVISNLRKAINYRVKNLFKNLGIAKSTFNKLNSNKKEKLERLEELGIVKAFLIRKLIEIRNGIEYDGHNPPSKAVCQELIDIVWYFYKSTDRYCNIIPGSVIIEWTENNKNFFLSLDFDFENHQILKFSGRLPDGYISQEKIDSNSLLLENLIIKDYSEDDQFNDSEDYHMFYKAEVATKNINNYLELFTLVLSEWGN